MAASQQSAFSTLTLADALEDLTSRFLVNLPPEELAINRVLFQVEQAHWYYEDFIRPEALNSSLLPSYTLKNFSHLMFRECPLLHDLAPRHAEIWLSFMAYKERVPVCGAILISESWDKVLLVRGFQKGASWSFPRGKINKEEPEADCAVREVLEETGYDLLPHFPVDYNVDNDETRDPYFVELVIKEQRIRLYFIPHVKEDAHFETRTRKEIGKIDWFAVSDLPTWKSGKKVVPVATKQAKYYMVTPFVSHLKLWIQHNRPKKGQGAAAPNQIPQHVATEQYRPPLVESDADLGRSTSVSSVSEEDVAGVQGDDEDETSRRPRVQFASVEQGTLALQAFFFGAVTSTPQVDHDDRFVSAPGTDEDDPIELKGALPGYRTVTPPRHPPKVAPLVAFERQQPLLQPTPKGGHTANLLLALLTNQDPVASPPPRPNEQVRLPVAPGLSTLLSSLNGLLAPQTQQHASAPQPPPFPAFHAAPASTQEQEDFARVQKRSALLSALIDLPVAAPSIENGAPVDLSSRPQSHHESLPSHQTSPYPPFGPPLLPRQNSFGPPGAGIPLERRESRQENGTSAPPPLVEVRAPRLDLLSILTAGAPIALPPHLSPQHLAPLPLLAQPVSPQRQLSTQPEPIVSHTAEQRQLLSLLQQQTFGIAPQSIQLPPLQSPAQPMEQRPSQDPFGRFSGPPPPMQPGMQMFNGGQTPGQYAPPPIPPMGMQQMQFPPSHFPQQFPPPQHFHHPPPPFQQQQQFQAPPPQFQQPMQQQQPPPQRPFVQASHVIDPRTVIRDEFPPLGMAPPASTGGVGAGFVGGVKSKHASSLLSIFNKA